MHKCIQGIYKIGINIKWLEINCREQMFEDIETGIIYQKISRMGMTVISTWDNIWLNRYLLGIRLQYPPGIIYS